MGNHVSDSIANLRRALKIRRLLEFHKPNKSFLNNDMLNQSILYLSHLIKVTSCDWKGVVPDLIHRHENSYEVGVYILSLNIQELSLSALKRIKKKKKKNPEHLTDKLRLLSLSFSYNASVEICRLVADIYQLNHILHYIKPTLENMVKQERAEAFKWLVLLSPGNTIDPMNMVHFLSTNNPLALAHLITLKTQHIVALEDSLYESLAKCALSREGLDKRDDFDRKRKGYCQLLEMYFTRVHYGKSIDSLVKYLCWKFAIDKSMDFSTFHEACLDISSVQLNKSTMVLTMLIMFDKLDVAAYFAQNDVVFRNHWPLSETQLTQQKSYQPKYVVKPKIENFTQESCCIQFIREQEDFEKLHWQMSRVPVCCFRIYKLLCGIGPFSIIAIYLAPNLYIVDLLDNNSNNTLKKIAPYFTDCQTLTGFNVTEDLLNIQKELNDTIRLDHLKQVCEIPIPANMNIKLGHINKVLASRRLPLLKKDTSFFAWSQRPIKKDYLDAVVNEFSSCYTLFKSFYCGEILPENGSVSKEPRKSAAVEESATGEKIVPLEENATLKNNAITENKKGCVKFCLPEYKSSYYRVYCDEPLRGLAMSLSKKGADVKVIIGDKQVIYQLMKNPENIFLTKRKFEDVKKEVCNYCWFASCLTLEQMEENINEITILKRLLFETRS